MLALLEERKAEALAEKDNPKSRSRKKKEKAQAQPVQRVKSASNTATRTNWLPLVLLTTALTAAALVGGYYYLEHEKVRDEYATLLLEQEGTTMVADDSLDAIMKLQQELTIYNNQQYEMVFLQPTGKLAGAKALAFYNPVTKSLSLTNRSLPYPGEDFYYVVYAATTSGNIKKVGVLEQRDPVADLKELEPS